ncbi:hypothetical protein D9M70_452500 [compost metagenome]
MQGAGQLAIDLADGEADLGLLFLRACLCRKLLGGFFPLGATRFACSGFSSRFRLLLLHVCLGALEQVFWRTHVHVVAQFDTKQAYDQDNGLCATAHKGV